MDRLVLLSHLGPAGYREANKLIDKMLKMLHTGKASKPSLHQGGGGVEGGSGGAGGQGGNKLYWKKHKGERIDNPSAYVRARAYVRQQCEKDPSA